MVDETLGWPTWIGVVANDLEVQRRFYRDTLGLRETSSGPGWVQFDLGGNMFEVIQRQDIPQYDGRRCQIGFSVQDIASARAELIRRGVEPLTEIEPTEAGGTANRWCYFRDAEGNVFEITEWLQPG